MAKPRIPYPLQKVTLQLRLGDWVWLKTVHGQQNRTKIVRELVMRYVDRSNAGLPLDIDATIDVINAQLAEMK